MCGSNSTSRQVKQAVTKTRERVGYTRALNPQGFANTTEAFSTLTIVATFFAHATVKLPFFTIIEASSFADNNSLLSDISFPEFLVSLDQLSMCRCGDSGSMLNKSEDSDQNHGVECGIHEVNLDAMGV